MMILALVVVLFIVVIGQLVLEEIPGHRRGKAIEKTAYDEEGVGSRGGDIFQFVSFAIFFFFC